MDRKRNDDDLAYGQYHGGEDEATGERGLLGDVYGRLAHRPAQGNAPQGNVPGQSLTAMLQPQLAGAGRGAPAPYGGQPQQQAAYGGQQPAYGGGHQAGPGGYSSTAAGYQPGAFPPPPSGPRPGSSGFPPPPSAQASAGAFAPPPSSYQGGDGYPPPPSGPPPSGDPRPGSSGFPPPPGAQASVGGYHPPPSSHLGGDVFPPPPSGPPPQSFELPGSEPVAEQQKPAASYQPGGVYQPGGGYQQPGGGYQQPGAGYQSSGTGYQQPGSNQPAYTSPPTGQGQYHATGVSALFEKVHGKVHDAVGQLTTDFRRKLGSIADVHSHTHPSRVCAPGFHDAHAAHRFKSFAPERPGGNDAKWHVDGCGYMYAVSVALERAQQSVWIMDWWLSPELYLRRPPAKNEQYRLDRMLKAAAERGVKVNVMVYKEVTQALTLSSSHTKHALEDLHANIAVVRHPDHLPDQATVAAEVSDAFKNFKLTAASASKLPGDTLKAIYGVAEDSVLYWAHHEKLCIVDGRIAFMGGLDLCYGRWDTYQHGISDVHPNNVYDQVFVGQDYNNARIKDFQDVTKWTENQLDRTKSSRMGWSDVSLSLMGPAVEDLKEHFVERWNFIYNEKYKSRPDPRYARLEHASIPGEYDIPGQPSIPVAGSGYGHVPERGLMDVKDRLKTHLHRLEDRLQDYSSGRDLPVPSGFSCQIVRSCAKWSHGQPLEHSIANAYIEVISRAEHFIYIENQFFITATDQGQGPVKNLIGAAIVDRILRAARERRKFKVVVVMPAIPAFAGDLRGDDALGTRAIMNYQFHSISRGGRSIYDRIAQAGYNPMEYIRFYNLRNYDRINSSTVLDNAQQESGVSYSEASAHVDSQYGGGFQAPGPDGESRGHGAQPQHRPDAATEYQQAVGKGGGDDRWDSVAECYMLNGPSIESVPWNGRPEAEMDAFVTEELYVHSKLLIADDRVVICGSANLNDRSQLGDHDSELAIVISSPPVHPSRMHGRPYNVCPFAASLRRFIFRKHLGLVAPQDPQRPEDGFYPVGTAGVASARANLAAYDFGSAEDLAVEDPLDDRFEQRWNATAQTNTAVFDRAFHVVPSNRVRTWRDYDEFYEKNFRAGDDKKGVAPGPYGVGHVVRDEFPGGVTELKRELAKVRGSLVEMPLLFLKDEKDDKAFVGQGLALNSFTEEVYT